eukprot:934715-Prorocentrum_minimum.AAC.1
MISPTGRVELLRHLPLVVAGVPRRGPRGAAPLAGAGGPGRSGRGSGDGGGQGGHATERGR